jgi:hypothetical protein
MMDLVQKAALKCIIVTNYKHISLFLSMTFMSTTVLALPPDISLNISQVKK